MQLKHTYSTIDDKNLSYKFGSSDQVYKNRKNFFLSNNLDIKEIYGVQLEHGNKILNYKESSTLQNAEDSDLTFGDGIWTREPHIPLFILTADCVPVIIYNTRTPFLALLHCGWKSLDDGIIIKCLNLIKEFGDIDFTETKLIAGPHIMRESYIVTSPEQATKKDWKRSIVKLNQSSYSIHLQRYIFDQAQSYGLLTSNMTQNHIDTYVNKNYFSYRRSIVRDLPQGRFGTLAWLED